MNRESLLHFSALYSHFNGAPVYIYIYIYTTRHIQTYYTAVLIVNGKINNANILLQHKCILLAMLRPFLIMIKLLCYRIDKRGFNKSPV